MTSSSTPETSWETRLGSPFSAARIRCPTWRADTSALPVPVARFLRVIIALLIAGMLVFLFWFGLEYMDRTQYQLTPSTQISFAYIYAGLPIGSAMALIHWLLIVRDYVLERRFASDEHFDATASASL